MRQLLGISIVGLLVGCSDKTPAPRPGVATVRRPFAESSAAGPDSARAFTQRFYDWYLAAQAGHGQPYDSLTTTRREWLSDTLARALQADLAMQHADTIAEIASLSAEADVFLNSQDPCSRYTARAPRALGTAGFAIAVAGDCGGLDRAPNIEVLVRPRGAGWEIVNLKDPRDASYDLLSAFAHYRADMSAPRDSPGKDTAHVGSS